VTDDILVNTTRGASWALGWRLLTRLLGLVNTLVLARLLVPGDFGLVAIATGFSQGIMALSQVGMEDALIRHRHATREHYDTAFTINLLRGLATSAVVAALAWPVAAFFSEPRLGPVLLTLAACSLVTAFDNIATIEFRRDFAFAREFKLLLLPRLLAIAVTLSVAAFTHSHWALVAGIATSLLLSTFMGYRMHAYRPRLSLAHWHELSRLSQLIWASGVVVMLRDRIDGFVVGRMLGLQQAGVYLVGAELATIPTHELAGPIGRASFPSLSAAVRAGAETSQAYLRILAGALLVSLPAGVLVTLLAEPIVLLALGAQWTAAIPVMRILGVVGAALALGSVTSMLLSAHGILRPGFNILLLSTSVRLLGALALVGPLGLVGAALAHALTIVVENFGFVIVAFRHFGIRAAELLASVWRSVFAAALMAAALWAGSGVLPAGLPLLTLAAGAALGLAVYAAVLALSWLACGRPAGAERDLFALLRRMALDAGLLRLLRR
jgi:O-antigen/teichoic acid export membrane protein